MVTKMNTRHVFDTALFAKIQGLDLSQIKLYFTIRQSWSLEKAENAISGYHQFLYLVDKVGGISPPKDIDEIWHRHILHTKQYAEDCQKVFGRFIHHSPFPISNNIEKVLDKKIGCSDFTPCDGGGNEDDRSIKNKNSCDDDCCALCGVNCCENGRKKKNCTDCNDADCEKRSKKGKSVQFVKIVFRYFGKEWFPVAA